MLKQCRYCRKEYDENHFGIALTRNEKVYRRHKCRYCYRQSKKNLILKYRRWIEDYKKQRYCERCEERDFRVLDFHHSNKDKDFNISEFQRSAGFKKLTEEVEKCVLLCANCHRVVHYEAEALDRGVAQSGSARGLGP